MTISHLTSSHAEMLDQILLELEGQGYTWSRATQSLGAFLSDVYTDMSGQPISPKTSSLPKIVAALANEVTGGSVSHLHMSMGDLLEILANGLSEVGGDVPAWVPAEAEIHIDLQRAFAAQDAAWVRGVGVVAVNTQLGSDANTENAWGETGYDADDLTDDGLECSAFPPALIGAARTKVFEGATVRIQVKQTDGNTDIIDFALMSEDGNDAVVFEAGAGDGLDISVTSYGGSISSEILSIYNVGVGAINALACTVTAARADVASNGSDAVAGVLDETDRPPGNPLVAAVVGIEAPLALQSITLYDTYPSTTGLAALSDTGVTNTAPHDVAFEWQTAVSSSGSDATYGADSFVTANITPVEVAVLSATDDEGNPLTWTLPDDGSGKFDISGTLRVIAILAAGGPYSGTVRATDPGGLYVEQVFTITVTA